MPSHTRESPISSAKTASASAAARELHQSAPATAAASIAWPDGKEPFAGSAARAWMSGNRTGGRGRSARSLSGPLRICASSSAHSTASSGRPLRSETHTMSVTTSHTATRGGPVET